MSSVSSRLCSASEGAGGQKGRPVDLKVLLLDGDDDLALQDRMAVSDFPATLEELKRYDVVILAVQSDHKKLKNHLKNIASFVRGEAGKPGGGLLFIAGAAHNPHRFKDTPLEAVMPIEAARRHRRRRSRSRKSSGSS